MASSSCNLSLRLMAAKIKKITKKTFRRYGWVIEPTCRSTRNKKKSVFEIVLTETKKSGWRIAYLVLRENTIDRLESHPDSFESFEPVSGKTLLYVAASCDHKKINCFYLDKPVILGKRIWHGVVTLTKESRIKITENAQVKCNYWPHFNR